jgi:hypothetical protein
LKVLSGPHLGAEMALAEGTYTVGSDDSCSLILADSLVAGHHATLTIAHGVVRCVPAGGRVILDGGEAPADGVELRPFEMFGLGGTYLVTGPEGGEWPAFSPPGLRRAAPEPGPAAPLKESDTAAATPPSAEVEPSPAAVEVGPDRAHARMPRIGNQVLLLAFVLLNVTALVGAGSYWLFGGLHLHPMPSLDPVARLVEVVRSTVEVVRIVEGQDESRVEGEIPSAEQRRHLVERLRTVAGLRVEAGPEGTYRVEGRVGAHDRPERLTELGAVDEGAGTVRLEGSLLGDRAREELLERLRGVPGLSIREAGLGGPMRLEGTVRNADVPLVQALLWRLAAATVTVRADGRMVLDGYLRTFRDRRALEGKIRGLPPAPAVTTRLRDMEGLVRVAHEVIASGGLPLRVEPGVLGQLVVLGAVAEKDAGRWAALKDRLGRDLTRALDVRDEVVVGHAPKVAARPAPALTAAPAPTRPALPAIQSLHVGTTRSITLRDGQRLVPGSQLADGTRLTEIREDGLALVDRAGRTWRYETSDLPGAPPDLVSAGKTSPKLVLGASRGPGRNP